MEACRFWLSKIKSIAVLVLITLAVLRWQQIPFLGEPFWSSEEGEVLFYHQGQLRDILAFPTAMSVLRIQNLRREGDRNDYMYLE